MNAMMATKQSIASFCSAASTLCTHSKCCRPHPVSVSHEDADGKPGSRMKLC